MFGRTSLILSAMVLVSVLAIACLNRASAQGTGNTGPGPADQTLSQVLTRNFRVSLDVGSGASRLDQIRRIEFHEQYVVMIDYAGAGRVVPVSQIKQLTWEPI
jgi:hypothetical protein